MQNQIFLLENGQIFKTKKIRALYQDSTFRASADFHAPRGKGFLCVLLGVENLDISTLDVDATMRELGWERIPTNVSAKELTTPRTPKPPRKKKAKAKE